MSENTTDDDTTRTTIEVPSHLWRQVRADSIVNDRRVSEELAAILRSKYGDSDE